MFGSFCILMIREGAGLAHWNLDALFNDCAFRVIGEEGALQQVCYQGEPFCGQETEVFAYLGIPKRDEPVPGMVCVHGGGGRAFPEWVEQWMDRGYAAISMDLSGRGIGAERLPNGGPEQDHPAKFGVDLAWQDMWTYHAGAAVIRAHSILRGLPEVGEHVGVTGISWGGYLTNVVVGVDDRFACAMPVYGCGFLQDNSADEWMKVFAQMTPERRQWWHEHCDPSVYLPQAKMPMCFVTGTNDFAYPMDSLQKSYRLPQGDVTLSIRHEMAHGHPPGWSAPDLGLFADQHCRTGVPLPMVGDMVVDGSRVVASFESLTPLTKGELVYTCENGKWQDRKWYKKEATLSAGELVADVPEGCCVCYLAVADVRGAYVSAPHIEL